MVAGRIKGEDVELVKERAKIDEVVREYVSLKSAGGGSLKGLCPFHDERSPSFNVNPSKAAWYCFGCGEGGDTIGFLRKIDHLSFTEAVEKLADKYGVQLRYEEAGAAPVRQVGQRSRLVEAHKVAAAFYVANLELPDAQIGRTFLKERGFDSDAAARFGVGFAPVGWDGLVKHLRGAGFSDEEMQTAGLAVAGQRGAYDRFRGRLVWPIREASGDTVGFGARRLREDDDGPKYLNTPETPLYKKSQVLYGIDLARREIAKQKQAVIVEGYTDVMAAHLAGVDTAIATCGTSFGGEHVKVLRRLLMDNDVFGGEVIFTFDGDAAGQKAALRAFAEDQKFVARTFVAVEPTGLDPCELRQTKGDQAVRDLVESKVPLFEFAIRAALAGVDTATAEGRIAGMRAAAPVVAAIRDEALRPEYVRLLAGWLGMDVAPVAKAVKDAPRVAPPREAAPEIAPGPRLPRPDPRDLVAAGEREALKVILQEPELAGTWVAAVETTAFTAPAYIAVHGAVTSARASSPDATDRIWLEAVLAASPDDGVRRVVLELSVEPLPKAVADERYAVSVLARLLERDASRRIADLKARLSQASPTDVEYNQLFADVLALEQYRRGLSEQWAGS